MSDIHVEQITKTFGGHAALKGVSVHVGTGEMVALIGASGSGKSTLIRTISGLVCGDKTGGSVRIGGAVMQEKGRLSPQAKTIRGGVGVIFQQFNLVSRLSVLTNVLVGFLGQIPALRGTFALFTREEKMKALTALDRVGIAHTARRRASTLSGGQQQRAAIARALVQNAQVILADEPIASLDPASAKKVMETLSAINRDEGITIVVSLHQVEYARRYCPRTIALRDGMVAYDGPSAALTNDFLRELYGEASEELVLPDAPLRPAPVREGIIAGPSLATA
ncbi:phosphonate ABC transporter ATPase [Stappia sp. 22II-S9-Z10]|nr:phosphonate ABC transporter ATPase [Stappia sp. 22II-S9-Z10]